MAFSKLKKFLDSQIGEHGYICIYKGKKDKKFYCEGKVAELRATDLWKLIDEENAKISCSYSGQSENGRKCINIILA
jgi:hypothetical protein